MRQFMMTVMALAAFGAVVVTAQAEKKQTARSSQQTVSAAQQAMQECRRQYGGAGPYDPRPRFYLRDQWAWIEGCFKEKTGLYPGQAK
jgi:hypothetical protein